MRKSFHSEFRSWVSASYVSVDEEGWADLVRRDEEHDYMAYPTEKGPAAPLQSSSPILSDPSPSDRSAADLSLGPNPATYHF